MFFLSKDPFFFVITFGTEPELDKTVKKEEVTTSFSFFFRKLCYFHGDQKHTGRARSHDHRWWTETHIYNTTAQASISSLLVLLVPSHPGGPMEEGGGVVLVWSRRSQSEQNTQPGVFQVIWKRTEELKGGEEEGLGFSSLWSPSCPSSPLRITSEAFPWRPELLWAGRDEVVHMERTGRGAGLTSAASGRRRSLSPHGGAAHRVHIKIRQRLKVSV